MRKPAVLILMALTLIGCGNTQLDKITGLIEKNNQVIERNSQAVLASLEKHHTQNSWGKIITKNFAVIGIGVVIGLIEICLGLKKAG